jgi:uncharacterized cupredoxin-like copper-binding protein
MRMQRLAAALLVAFTACGRAIPDAEAVVVDLTEWTFETPRRTFTAGTPYRFVLRNTGTQPHEWVVVPRGDSTETRALVEVEEDRLPAGAAVERTFIFETPGEYDFACFVEGHYEAGMRIPVTVVAP